MGAPLPLAALAGGLALAGAGAAFLGAGDFAMPRFSTPQRASARRLRRVSHRAKPASSLGSSRPRSQRWTRQQTRSSDLGASGRSAWRDLWLFALHPRDRAARIAI